MNESSLRNQKNEKSHTLVPTHDGSHEDTKMHKGLNYNIF